jgi:hypothetical protein
MDVIKKSDMADSYWRDGYSGNEIIDMIRYEEIPTIKAIPLDKVKKARKEIENLASWDECCVEVYDVLEILDELIEREE